MARPETWARGDLYEQYMGRWSRPLAVKALDWLSPDHSLHWLDVGCGTGPLSTAILNEARPAALTGVDSSPGFAQTYREQVRGLEPPPAVAVADAQHLSFRNDSFDFACSGLVLNFVPDQVGALSEAARAVRPGGRVAAYVWEYAGGMEMLHYFFASALALDPAAAHLDEAARFPMCNADGLTELFTRAGLDHIRVGSIDTVMHFRDFDDYWTPFLGGQGAAPTYVATLTEDRRDRLRDHLCEHLPYEPDGSIRLTARAWAAQGVVTTG